MFEIEVTFFFLSFFLFFFPLFAKRDLEIFFCSTASLEQLPDSFNCFSIRVWREDVRKKNRPTIYYSGVLKNGEMSIKRKLKKKFKKKNKKKYDKEIKKKSK